MYVCVGNPGLEFLPFHPIYKYILGPYVCNVFAIFVICPHRINSMILFSSKIKENN